MSSLKYNGKKSSFEEQLDMSISDCFFFYKRNLRVLAIEMYKIYHGFSNGFKKELFTLRHQNQYNLRKWSGFCVLIIRSVDLGSEGVS